MAAAEGSIAQPENQVIELAKVLATAAPALFGSRSNTGTVESGGIPSGVSSNMDAVINALLPQITGTTQADSVVQNIFQRAAIAFAPTAGLQNQAGMNSSTTAALLRNDAIARATGEASAAVLQSQQQSASTAAQLLTSQGKLQQTTNKTAQAITPGILGANPLETLLKAAVVGYGADKTKKFLSPYFDKAGDKVNEGLARLNGADSDAAIYGNAGDVTVENAAGGSTGVFTGGGANVLETGDSLEFTALGMDASRDAAVGSLTSSVEPVAAGNEVALNDTASFLGGASGAAGGTSLAGPATAAINITGADTAAGIVDSSSGAFLNATPLGGGDTAADFVGSSVGADTAIASEAGGAAEAGSALATAGEAAEGFELADAAVVAAAWVICTDLNKRGVLSDELYQASVPYFKALHRETVAGYHLWAIPYTRAMQKSLLLRRLVTPAALCRARHLAGQWNTVGWLTVVVGEPICRMLGKLQATVQLLNGEFQ